MKKILKYKSPGFLLSVESLLAATFFALTCALSLNLVWSGFSRLKAASFRLEQISFINNKVHELDLTKVEKENIIKKYETTFNDDILKISRMPIHKKSSLAEFSKILVKYEFLKSEENESDSPILTGFFPYFLEED